jgi:GNAT superfamily N-acetyltransferase
LSDNRFEAYAIEFEGLTQGLLWLETQWHCSWLNPAHRLVYIEALASAPWNRKIVEDPPYLKGVGSALLAFARQRSLELGYQGRVGLHSLPQAEVFYQIQNMPDYGQDPDKDNLRYFEFGSL